MNGGWANVSLHKLSWGWPGVGLYSSLNIFLCHTSKGMLRVRYVLSADYQVAEYLCSNESSFSHLCDSLNNRIEPNCIEFAYSNLIFPKKLEL